MSIVPETAALKEHPEFVIHDINDIYPEFLIFVTISSNPFLNQDLFFNNVREKHASSMFAMTLICWIVCAIFTAKYDLIGILLSSSSNAGLDFPILYESLRLSFMYFLTKWIGA